MKIIGQKFLTDNGNEAVIAHITKPNEFGWVTVTAVALKFGKVFYLGFQAGSVRSSLGINTGFDVNADMVDKKLSRLLGLAVWADKENRPIKGLAWVQHWQKPRKPQPVATSRAT